MFFQSLYRYIVSIVDLAEAAMDFAGLLDEALPQAPPKDFVLWNPKCDGIASGQGKREASLVKEDI